MKKVIIYVLIDPRTNMVRYVGKTTNIKKRLNKHINESKRSTKSHKKAWINGLLRLDLLPTIKVIDEVSIDEWQFWEMYWISQMKALGFRLTNHTNGGEGVNIGNIPWNKGTKGIMKPNNTTFVKGNIIGTETRIKKGERLSPKTEFKKGHKPINSKEIWQYDLNGNLINKFDSYRKAAININVNTSAIQNCIRRKTFKCKGYIWRKIEK